MTALPLPAAPRCRACERLQSGVTANHPIRCPKHRERLAVETDLKRAVVDALRKAHWRVYVTSERRRGYSKMPVGWPDLFARHVEKRVCVWIEVKRPGENLSPEQLEFQLDALAAGERHWIIMSLNELTFQLARV